MKFKYNQKVLFVDYASFSFRIVAAKINGIRQTHDGRILYQVASDAEIYWLPETELFATLRDFVAQLPDRLVDPNGIYENDEN